jgi:hypothetical protein
LRHTGPTAAGLAVIAPAPNAVFALSPRLPLPHQRVEVAAVVTGGTLRDVTLLVNGEPLATPDGPPYRASWLLSPGVHEVRAVGSDGDDPSRLVESEVVRFRVVEESGGGSGLAGRRGFGGPRGES